MSEQGQPTSCEKSLTELEKILHTLVVWSNIFYLLSAIFAFARGYYIFGIMITLLSVISTIHHSGLGNQNLWKNLDTLGANITGIIIFIYTLWYVIKNKKYREKTNIILFFIITILTIFTFIFYLFSQIEGRKGFNDEQKGFTGPLLTQSALKASTPEQKSESILYLVYHTIWHMFGGIVGMLFFVIL